MTMPPVVHGTFTLERNYPVSAARLYAAWTDPEIKARWFIGPAGWQLVKRELDLRVGGREILEGVFPDGLQTLFTARYHEVVPEQRLVWSYDLDYAGKHLSVSLATVEIRAAGRGAALRFTEQAAFLDGTDGTSSRERGTAAHLDRLAGVLG
jgi:uncharacterized protein YndB with AHSA1/START domain